MGTIVLGYDGSDGSREALKVAADLARGMGDTVLATFGYAQYAPGGENRDHELAVADLAKGRLDEAVANLTAAGVTCEALLVHQNASDALLEVASQREARMIVVGSAGEHPLLGALLGSTAYKLVNRSDVPVLVVPV
jgi:nucleotide-binding universal stress UspA family protein